MPKHSLLDSLEVKSPCTESWDEMFGNDQVRFCSHCAKHVHNLSSMTHRDAMNIVAQSKGSICVRYVKRNDGRVSTVDRPLHQIGRRVKIAAGAIAATLSLSAIAYSQGEPKRADSTQIEKGQQKPGEKTDPVIVKLTIVDPAGAVIPGATVKMTNLVTKDIFTVISNEDGVAIFNLKEGGKFQILVSSQQYFKNVMIDDLLVNKNLELNITQEPTGEDVVVGIYLCDSGWYINDAISENDYEKVRDAIKEGADLNPKEASEEYPPPLHQAVALGHIRIVKLLLDNGANPNHRTSEGRVPLDYATSDEMRDLLKEYGAKEF